MRVLVVTSVSANIAELAALTLPNKAEYCLRHGYSLLAENMPYEQATTNLSRHAAHFSAFDIVWTLDCDAVITNMHKPIHELECLGPHVTVCEEKIVDWNTVNCGSVVWKNTEATIGLMAQIDADQPRWSALACGWQTWIGQAAPQMPDVIRVSPTREFNSVAWTHPGGGEIRWPGSHWQPGDLVYHPCGVFPARAKIDAVKLILSQVQR